MPVPGDRFGYVLPEMRSRGVEKEHELIAQSMPLLTAAGGSIVGTGEGKVALLHELLRSVAGYYPVMRQAIGDCFAAGTIVAGTQCKPIEDVQIGEYVFNGSGRLTEVVSKRSHVTFSPMVKLHAMGVDPLKCTADHKVLIYRMPTIGGNRVTTEYYKRAQRKEPQGFSKQAVKTAYEKRKPRWVAAGELQCGDYLLKPRTFGVLKADPHPLSWAMGYFVGNGYASKADSRAQSAEWTVPAKRFVDAVRIYETLAGAGYSPRIESCGERKAVRVRVHSRELCSLLRGTFYVNGQKVIPEFHVCNAAFFAGLFAADGHSRGARQTLDTTSPDIAYKTVAHLQNAGYNSQVSELVRSAGTYANAKKLYRVSWIENPKRNVIWSDDEFTCHPITKVERIEGPETVYDIGVKSRCHSFVANGVTVHNCVSFGWAKGIMIVLAADILQRGEREQWPGAEVATEWLYGTGRVLVGRGRLGNSDGSIGSWQAKAVTEHGTLLRKAYGSYNLSTYSGRTAKSWGYRGLPVDELEPTADDHPVASQPALVTSYEAARDAIANGYPVPVCSNQGFEDRRDSEGFARARGSWAHCMCFIASDDAHARPGLLCDNSWGANWISGPKRHNQPDGSFWVDADIADRMLRQQDSYAIPGYDGFARRDHRWTFV